MKKLLLFLTCLLTSTFVYPQITFEKTYGGINADHGRSVDQTSDGGYIITGYTDSYGIGSNDVYLLKTDANGDTLWTKTFGGTESDAGYSVVQTSDEGYIIAGGTSSFGAGNADVYLIRTNTNGDTLWTKTFGGTEYDEGRSIAQTIDSGFIITGYTSNIGWGGRDVYLIRTDANGDTLWSRTFGGAWDDEGYSIAKTSDSGFIIVGFADIYTGTCDVYLIKIDVNGNTLWSRTFGGAGNDGGFSVAQTNDGGYIVAGGTRSFGGGSCDVYLIKTDANGDTLWTKTFGGTESDAGYSVVQTGDEGYVISGVTESFGAGYENVYLIRTDSSGDTLWTKTFGGALYESGYSVVQTSDFGYVVAGDTWSFDAGHPDVYLIKTDSNGISNGTLGMNYELFNVNNGLRIYPNPTPGKVNIQIPQQFGKTKTLEIYDCIGQLQIEKTDNFSEIDFSLLTSGLYFIVLTNLENKRHTTKIIKE